MNGTKLRVFIICLSKTKLLFGENLAAVGIMQKRLNLVPFETPMSLNTK
jgi:hypothetical protein